MMMRRTILKSSPSLLKMRASANTKCFSNLSMFPEYTQAKKNFDEGQFQRALPDYQRIFEVVQSLNTAQCNPMLIEVTDQLVKSYLHLGQGAKALGVLHSASKMGSVTDKERVTLHLLTSKTHLWSGHVAQSLESARRATSTLEGLDQDGDIKLFADVYGQLGISNLLHGDVDEAEAYLQMAARWAQTPLQQLRTAINYGTVQYFRAASQSHFCLWQYHLQMITSTPQEFYQSFIQSKSGNSTKIDAKRIADLNTNISSTVTVVQQPTAGNVVSSSSNNKKLPDLDPESKKLIQFALDIWQDSVQEFIQSHSGQQSSAAAAAAMCGPIGANPSSSSAPPSTGTAGEMTMTGMMGDDVRVVPSKASSSATNSVVNADATAAKSLEQILQEDVSLALAYAHLLTNIAEIQDVLSPQSSDASHTLSTALKLLTPVAHLPVSQPYLARILKWIGFHHTCASQNVSAEGLYRSALDKLPASVAAAASASSYTAFAQFDKRHQFEAAMTRGLYAQVLQHWERREEQGKSIQGDVVTKELPKVIRSPSQADGDGFAFPLPAIPSQLIYPC